jgi:hypothetical protein
MLRLLATIRVSLHLRFPPSLLVPVLYLQILTINLQIIFHISSTIRPQVAVRA